MVTVVKTGAVKTINYGGEGWRRKKRFSSEVMMMLFFLIMLPKTLFNL